MWNDLIATCNNATFPCKSVVTSIHVFMGKKTDTGLNFLTRVKTFSLGTHLKIPFAKYVAEDLEVSMNNRNFANVK